MNAINRYILKLHEASKMNLNSSIQKHALALCICLGLVDFTCGAVVWSQEFDSPSIDSDVWTYDVGGGGFGNGELQYHTARWDNAYIENGNLVIEARRESYSGKSFTSSRLKTLGRFAFKYGTLEARIKIPNLHKGLWPAFWMMGENYPRVNWPQCGELDILEMGMKSAIDAGLTNRRVNSGAFWYYNGTASYSQQKDFSVDLNNDYHLYKLIWTPTTMSTYVDGTLVWVMTISSIDAFQKPMFIIMNLSVGGFNFVEITDPAQITAPFPARMYIDYIRLYDNAYTVLYDRSGAAEDGLYGVYTENSPVADHLTFGTDAQLYLWSNMTSATTTPYEGSEAWSFNVAAGTWFGMGVFCPEDKDMKNYSDGYLSFQMKTTTTVPFNIGILSSETGEKWLTFTNGGEQFGLIRDGAWHRVRIPLSRFGNVDFHMIQQLFMLKGEAPSAAFNISIDDVYWIPSVHKTTPTNGNFGVFTDAASHKDAGQFVMGTDGQFYIWEGTLVPRTQSPYEGANSMSFQSAAGKTWFGAAFSPYTKLNLSAYRYPESKLRFALKTNSTTTFSIGMKSGTVNDIGQKWITFASGSDPYGFVRDGAWHVVEIPMTEIAKDVDLTQVSQLFELLGVNGPISNIEIDDIYFTGGGTPLNTGDVNMYDLEMTADYWLNTACTVANDYCYGADTQPDGSVNLLDLAWLSQYWLD